MGRVAVFDSGLGSLSVIKAIQAVARHDLVYFADRQSFPYGSKPREELCRIVRRTVRMLRERFEPDLIVMASNTPTLECECPPGVVGVYPPLKEAAAASATGNIAVLATRAVARGSGLYKYMRSQNIPKDSIRIVDASDLVDMVESGAFLGNKGSVLQAIRDKLYGIFSDGRIDVATLSSTHLAFLAPYMELEFPGVRFLDPSESVAAEVSARVPESSQGSLQVYASGDVSKTERNLARLGIASTIRDISA